MHTATGQIPQHSQAVLDFVTIPGFTQADMPCNVSGPLVRKEGFFFLDKSFFQHDHNASN